MRELTRIQQVVFMMGGGLLLVSAVGYLILPELFQWSYIVGALMFASMQMLSRYEGDDIVVCRLRRQQVFSDVLLMLAGPLMVFNHHTVLNLYYLTNEWMLAIIVASVIQLYTAFRIPAELKKNE